MEKLTVGILCQDKNGKVIAANQKTADIFGIGLEKLHNQPFFEQMWNGIEKNGVPLSFENSPPMLSLGKGKAHANELLSIPGGKNIKNYILLNAHPVFEQNASSPAFVISTITDLGKGKEGQQTYEEPDKLFAGFLNQTPGFSWIVNEEEKIVFANQSLLDYFGADHSVYGKYISHVLPKSIADAGHEKHRWVLENNSPHTSILKSSLADGDENIYHAITFPIRGDHGRKLIGGQAWNITESYRSKMELKRANERLLYLSRAVSEAIWDWNIVTGQIFRNQSLLNLIGYQEENQEGLSWWFKQIHPEDRHKVEQKIEHILATKGKAWEQEYRFLCLDGSYKVVLDRGFVVYQNNQPVRMVGSLQDISEIKELEASLFREKLRKQKEIAEAILQAQEQERTRIGHELHDNVNQILFTSKLYLDIIKSSNEEEADIKTKTQEFILQAIEEIRKLSKELVTPKLKESGLIPCIRNLISQLDFIEPFVTNLVIDDEQKIEALEFNIQVTLFRIIQEQTKNIIKYSRAKNVLLQLSVLSKKIHLLIQDDGIGFDARQTRRGIGLSNIYERTNLYNGNVDLKTSPGKGCSIHVSIPLE